MASILTNQPSLQAAQAMAANGRDLATVQNRLATGKRVNSAKDDGAAYSIATRMRSEVAGWGVVGDSLARGQSTLDVAANGAEVIGGVLSQMKTKMLAYLDAPDSGGKAALRADIEAMAGQINRTANASAFDGENLLTAADLPAIDLTPYSTGLDPNNGAYAAIGQQSGRVNIDVDFVNAAYGFVQVGTPYVGVDVPMQEYGIGHHTLSLARPETDSDFFFLSIGTVINAASPPVGPQGALIHSLTFQPMEDMRLITNPAGDTTTIQHQPMTAKDLGLEPLTWDDPMGLFDKIGAAAASATASSAYIGGRQNLVESLQMQASKLQDTLTMGVGNLVDADMAKEAANLQAMQTKQGLAAQVLAIANAAPQWVLGLFRG
jgi:flagellin